MVVTLRGNFEILLLSLILLIAKCSGNDILGCGGFVKSHASLDFSKIEIGLYTKSGILKEKTECAPTNGYYFLPLYEKGEYILKVHPPPGWSFEPSKVELVVDGVTDQCSTGSDINFAFNGFGITGKVVTAGQALGPSGISIQLVDEKGEIRETVTSAGGDFHFTPVIPGKFTVKATHPRWKLEPSQTIVQVREGNTVLPLNALVVKGYDVRGSVHVAGNPIVGLHVLLYSKEERPKYRVEGCQTALLQGVPDAPICYSVTDASGEFSFGLVPAGDYRLLALAKTPGQAVVSFNVKPESVKFSVGHDSQFLANAFEVSGFTVTGATLTALGGSGVAGARVTLDGAPAGATDAAGRYTLAGLQPGLYTVGFQHEQCEFDDIKLSISANGAVTLPEARVARWKVCGVVTPADTRDITISADRSSLVKTVGISAAGEGQWCTYLPPGVYTARVEVSETEKSDGLQFYPLSQKVSVGAAPVAGVRFSQLKARLAGRVQCASPLCAGLPVTLQAPGGAPLTATVRDGAYSFSDVLPGSVWLSVPDDVLCWRAARHDVTVAAAEAAAPDFVHTGYKLRVMSEHNDVEWRSEDGADAGVASAAPAETSVCVARAARYTLTARGCSVTEPAAATVTTGGATAPLATFKAVTHEAVITVQAPDSVPDLVLRVGSARAGPLAPRAVGPHYEYSHRLQLAEGEVVLVSASSSTLLFSPRAPQQLLGGARCQPRALLLRGRRALTLAGATRPPVEGALVTLTDEDGQKQSMVTGADGAYRFGPLDAARRYSVAAEKDSWLMAAPAEDGSIAARRLASLTVRLADAQGAPLQGALVSVSGGAYRRNAASDAAGALRCGSLAPAEYYVKPHLKEFRFSPPHRLVTAHEGRDVAAHFVGERVAWSGSGRVVSLGGAGWPRADVLAAPAAPTALCRPEAARAESDGSFRIRGLVPGCQYRLQLRESGEPELAGLVLAREPPLLEVTGPADITGLRLLARRPGGLTDGAALVRARLPAHYATLRLALAPRGGPPLASFRIDASGFPPPLNPGVLVPLPRLAADNATYVLRLQSALSAAAHAYDEPAREFVSDGRYKHFDFDFDPRVKGAEQELRAASLLGLPLAALAVLAYMYRAPLLLALARCARAAAAAAAARRAGPRRRAEPRAEPGAAPDRALDHLVASITAPTKKPAKKKVQHAH